MEEKVQAGDRFDRQLPRPDIIIYIPIPDFPPALYIAFRSFSSL